MDRMRVSGPETSLPPFIPSEHTPLVHTHLSAQPSPAFMTAAILSQDHTAREDGRGANDARPLGLSLIPLNSCRVAYCTYGVDVVLLCGPVTQARGSAYVELGRTKVFAAW